jgi:hypothetical protein
MKKQRHRRRPTSLALCRMRVKGVLRHRDGIDERREAAEDCDTALKDAYFDCARALTRNEGRGKGLVKDALNAARNQVPGLKRFAIALKNQEEAAHGRGHHQGMPEALSDKSLRSYLRRAEENERPMRRYCRSLLEQVHGSGPR